jgi:hypothetical protein
MPRIAAVVTASMAWMAVAGNLRAQDTNTPRTNLEAFEAQTGAVIVKGTALIGTIEGQTGTVTVRCKEVTESVSGRKEHGVTIELKEGNHAVDVTTIDYEELDTFLNGLDKLGKASHAVTSLPDFDVLYTTGGGLRADVYTSNKRSGVVQVALQSSRVNRARVLLTMDQLAHFASLVQQAKSRLDQLRGNK